MTPIIGDLIESVAKNSLGKVIGAVVNKYLPASMSEAEKAQVELALQEGFREELKIDAEALETINKTMRAEAQSDKWWQSAWRPTVGFTFSAVIINNYILMPYFTWVQTVNIPQGVWNSILVVLGAAAATRGVERWQRERNKQ